MLYKFVSWLSLTLFPTPYYVQKKNRQFGNIKVVKIYKMQLSYASLRSLAQSDKYKY